MTISDTQMLINQLVILFVLLLLSGFFSSAETALFSISKAKAVHLAKEKGMANSLIKKMKDDHHRLLSTILIGNNIVNVGAAALATAVTIELVSQNAVGIATGIMTLLILIFGEIFPKSIATRNNILIARLVIIPLYWLSILFAPIIFMLNFIPKLTGKVLKKTTSDRRRVDDLCRSGRGRRGNRRRRKKSLSTTSLNLMIPVHRKSWHPVRICLLSMQMRNWILRKSSDPVLPGFL